MVDEIQMTEPKKVIAVNHEAPYLLKSYYNENDLYQVVNMSLDETKEKLNDASMRLNNKVRILLKIEIK